MSQTPDSAQKKATTGPRKPPRKKYPKVNPARPGHAMHAQYVQLADSGQILKPGLYWHGVRDSTNTDTHICSPLEVIAMTSDDKGENYGRLLRFLTPRGEWREWAAPMNMLAGDGGELRAELLRMGGDDSTETASGADRLPDGINPQTPRAGRHGHGLALP
ncbi:MULTISPECIES: DUF927 domain-containing protein [Tenebrionibacter/Tenebrionicola group]|jgi:putative DNA primase/helicase|uniref:DUF927 domain-containing protein n=1 Tax=Tenebrionibacter/Tenebrionicola group TaxID=2969848 RepID=UPI0021E18266|nr:MULTISPECIES: DUF927 domain-containing protein [Tenebrionibacter/Tenebrionicola group]